MKDQPITRRPITRYVKIPTGYLMVLRQGDAMFAELEAFMAAEDIPSATLAGFGFAGTVTFGFFDFAKKEYDPGTFEDMEMASITGTLAWKQGRPSVHAHGVAAAKDFTAVGGHLLALEVGTGSLEITIAVHDKRLERHVDPRIGANILSL
ncbi:PPC domain-containing DNA-binding protein [Microvirga lotononidis]|uniref:Putative DNA-binding protein with PD1-like DNA-binding motif n=1 Tax=Microvirga lotononidis TaxID=864069 RepID=I4Z1V6_9HYPH|nr:PPC domain-containing DNA-binding protein [Microvirga lotononidis]EIM30198.1 putative DNA-binding protein with PD1-like DNA-binding motif [Microvirga lotononidis]WQO31578.1 PPC domain-containing DNA-binding protein [Microvirga lotononidis]